MSKKEDSWDSEEMRKNERLERLCGSVDRAFRLSYLYRTTQQDCSGWKYKIGALDTTIPTFKTRANDHGYSQEAINLFLEIQG